MVGDRGRKTCDDGGGVMSAEEVRGGGEELPAFSAPSSVCAGNVACDGMGVDGICTSVAELASPSICDSEDMMQVVVVYFAIRYCYVGENS